MVSKEQGLRRKQQITEGQVTLALSPYTTLNISLLEKNLIVEPAIELVALNFITYTINLKKNKIKSVAYSS